MGSEDTGLVLPDSFDVTDDDNSIRLRKEFASIKRQNEELKRQLEALKKENSDGVRLAKILQEEKIACQKTIDMLLREIKRLKTFHEQVEENFIFKFKLLKVGVTAVLQEATVKKKTLVEKIKARLDSHPTPSSFLRGTSFCMEADRGMTGAVNSLLETLDESVFVTALKTMIVASGDCEKFMASFHDEREKFASSLREMRHSTVIDDEQSNDDSSMMVDGDKDDDDDLLVEFEPVNKSRSEHHSPPENLKTPPPPRGPALIPPGSKEGRRKEAKKQVKFAPIPTTNVIIERKDNIPAPPGPLIRGKHNKNNGGVGMPSAAHATSQFVLIRESKGNKKPNWKYFVARLVSQAKMKNVKGNRKVFKVDYYTRQYTFDSFYAFKLNPKKQAIVIDEDDIVISDLPPPFHVTSQNILQFNFNFNCKEYYNLSY